MESHDNCDNDFIKEVMASMGWQNSFVPLASDENKNLLAGIKFLGTTKLKRIDALEAQEKEALRIGYLFNSADNEFDQSLKLLTAHKSQYSTEHHLYKLAEYEESKYKQLLKDINKSLKELTVEEESLKSDFSTSITLIPIF